MTAQSNSIGARLGHAMVGALALGAAVSAGARPLTTSLWPRHEGADQVGCDRPRPPAQPPSTSLWPWLDPPRQPRPRRCGADSAAEASKHDLRYLAAQVAIDVERTTGWTLRLRPAKITLGEAKEAVGYVPLEETEQTRGCGALAASFNPATFDYTTSEIVVRRTFLRHATWDSVRHVLFHELFHLGQLQNNRTLFSARDAALDAITAAIAQYGEGSLAALDATRAEARILQDIEGQAHTAGDAAAHLYPHSNLETLTAQGAQSMARFAERCPAHLEWLAYFAADADALISRPQAGQATMPNEP